MEQPEEARRLSDLVRDVLRRRHYSLRTENTYLAWMTRFVLFHHRRHPEEMGTAEVIAFLTHLAVERRVGPSTQRQAKSALVFLYRTVLERELPGLENAVRARGERSVPVVLTIDEVRSILGELHGWQRLIATMLYGCGLRRIECLRLRVKDLDFARSQLCVRQGKGRKDRYTALPKTLAAPMAEQVRALHEQDLRKGHGCALSPTHSNRSSGRVSQPHGDGSGSSPPIA